MAPNTTMINALSELLPVNVDKNFTSFSDKSTTRSIAYYGLDAVNPVKHVELVDSAVVVADEIMTQVGLGISDGNAAIKALLENPQVKRCFLPCPGCRSSATKWPPSLRTI